MNPTGDIDELPSVCEILKQIKTCADKFEGHKSSLLAEIDTHAPVLNIVSENDGNLQQMTVEGHYKAITKSFNEFKNENDRIISEIGRIQIEFNRTKKPSAGKPTVNKSWASYSESEDELEDEYDNDCDSKEERGGKGDRGKGENSGKGENRGKGESRDKGDSRDKGESRGKGKSRGKGERIYKGKSCNEDKSNYEGDEDCEDEFDDEGI